MPFQVRVTLRVQMYLNKGTLGIYVSLSSILLLVYGRRKNVFERGIVIKNVP